MPPLLLRDGCVVTMDAARRVLRGAQVLVDDGRIRALGDELEAPDGATVIDCTDCVVIPGLVQAHVHLCQTLARGRADDAPLLDWLRATIWPYEASLDSDTAAASALLGCAELLLGGTTAILDMGTVRWQDEIFEACRAAGIRATSGKAMMDRGEGVPAALLETARDSITASEALASRWHEAESGRLRYAWAPRFVLSASEELLRGAAEAARAGGQRLHTHASENRDECDRVRSETGLDNVEYLHRVGLAGADVVVAHAVWVTERERGLLAQSGTHIAHCPSSNLKLASGIAPLPELLEAGISVALGSDGAACNNNLDAFLEMRLAALLHRPRIGVHALGARRALELATIGGAQALGLEREIGSIEVGKRADLCVVDVSRVQQAPLGTLDPYSAIVYASGAKDVRDVVVDGRLVVRGRELLTLDVGELLAWAREAGARLGS
jgi:cytosine/adenosine deaminase-related metal-dependent hydrolase